MITAEWDVETIEREIKTGRKDAQGNEIIRKRPETQKVKNITSLSITKITSALPRKVTDLRLTRKKGKFESAQQETHLMMNNETKNAFANMQVLRLRDCRVRRWHPVAQLHQCYLIGIHTDTGEFRQSDGQMFPSTPFSSSMNCVTIQIAQPIAVAWCSLQPPNQPRTARTRRF